VFLFFPEGQENFDAVNAVVIAEAKMNTQVGLRKIAAAAHHFACFERDRLLSL